MRAPSSLTSSETSIWRPGASGRPAAARAGGVSSTVASTTARYTRVIMVSGYLGRKESIGGRGDTEISLPGEAPRRQSERGHQRADREPRQDVDPDGGDLVRLDRAFNRPQ